MTDQNTTSAKVTSTLAKTDDGSIQMNFTIPYSLVIQSKQTVLEHLARETEIPGFRKGNAPITKVEESIGQQALTEKILGSILPQSLTELINQNKLHLAIYPKFEATKITENEDWQIKATSCEIPEVVLGDYKKNITGALRAKAIWTPAATTDKKPDTPPTREEKEQVVIKSLLESIKLNLPKILVEEEVNLRLSNLLERLEKLGLTLESYLASIGKTGETLRQEYQIQAISSISLELILEKIAQEEKITVSEADIDSTIKAASQADPKLSGKMDNPDQRRLISSVLRRRGAIDYLTSLV